MDNSAISARHPPGSPWAPLLAAACLAALAPAPAAAQNAYDPSLLFDWAERTYPALFPGPESNRVAPPYVYRVYPATHTALGVANDVVAFSVQGAAPVTVGTLASFECAVLPSRCNGPTLEQRRAAAANAAQNHPDCLAAQPFYWSIGDAGGRLAEGQAGANAPARDEVMSIASASKWLYGAYVAEKRNGVLPADDISYLNFTSGYTQFDLCLPGQSVAECQAYQGRALQNGGFYPGQVGHFYYSGGHMQKHATLIGLGGDHNAELGRHLSDALGITLTYSQPQLAGGVVTSAEQYGRFLQAVAAGRLKISALLGQYAVCTDPATCPTALKSPAAGLRWHYSVGHWVESPPDGDGAFSSAGAFGFYPWLDASRTWWGTLARRDSGLGSGAEENDQRPGRESAICGGRIRRAWMTGGS